MRKKDVTKAQLNKPKARVTQADVYAALWKKEQADAERYSDLQRSINGLHERMTVHEQSHVADTNYVVQRGVTESKPPSAVKGAGIAGVLAGAVVGIIEALRRVVV